MIKRLWLILGAVIIVLIAVVFYFLYNIPNSINAEHFRQNSVVCGYSPASTCPGWGKECECSGKIINSYDLLSIENVPEGVSGNELCYKGNCGACKCYRWDCANRTKQYVDCRDSPSEYDDEWAFLMRNENSSK